jgi:hypothetical protein
MYGALQSSLGDSPCGGHDVSQGFCLGCSQPALPGLYGVDLRPQGSMPNPSHTREHAPEAVARGPGFVVDKANGARIK